MNNNPKSILGQTYNQYAQQGTSAQIAQWANRQAQMAQQQRQFNPNTWVEQRWQIDGKYMTLHDFVNFIWKEDCPDKTFFLLKYTKEIKND